MIISDDDDETKIPDTIDLTLDDKSSIKNSDSTQNDSHVSLSQYSLLSEKTQEDKILLAISPPISQLHPIEENEDNDSVTLLDLKNKKEENNEVENNKDENVELDNNSSNIQNTINNSQKKTSQTSTHSNVSEVMMCDLDEDDFTPTKKRSHSSSLNNIRSRSGSRSPILKKANKKRESNQVERERRTKKRKDREPTNKGERWKPPTLNIDTDEDEEIHLPQNIIDKTISSKTNNKSQPSV